MLSENKSLVLQEICQALMEGNTAEASHIACTRYPFSAPSGGSRSYNEHVCTRIFIRDGFTDRYSGHQLVFPGALRLLSRLLPEEFPFHPNWKMSESHLMFWELSPTIDHIVPVARGGVDNETNWVSTSMLRNSAKSNWTLEELDWNLLPPGDFAEWDGLVGWFLQYLYQYPEHLKDSYIKRWHDAARRALAAV